MSIITFRAPVDMYSMLGYDNSDSILSASATEIRIGTPGVYYDVFRGEGFTFRPLTGAVTGGTVTSFSAYEGLGSGELVSITGMSVPAAEMYGLLMAGDVAGLSRLVFAGDDSFTGSSGNDVILSYAGNDTLSGGEGNDTFDGGLGNDRMIGGNGDDFYFVRDAGDAISETSSSGGIDTVYSYLASHTLSSNVEIGRILSDAAANMVGNASSNLVYAGAGNNVIDGGAGADTVSYAYAASAVTASLATTAAQATGGSGTDTLLNVESLMGTAYGDKLTGNTGANTLTGYSGNDTLDGGAGIDSMVGGLGNDLYYVRDVGDAVSETSSSGGTDTVYSYLSSHLLGVNVENGRIVTSSASNLTGNSLNNALFAGAGNNVIDGGAGVDTLSYGYAASAVTASLATTAAQATGGSGTDTLRSIENLSGSKFNDKLTGAGGNNSLSGGDGNDTLDGGAGMDTMTGGLGNDLYYVRDVGDVASETSSSGGTDTVYSYLSSHVLGANVENGRIVTSGPSDLFGNSLRNSLSAGAGDNVIDGGAGVDTISYAHAASAVRVSLGSTLPQATGGSGTDTVLNIENILGSQFNDTITGSALANTITGGQGSDTVAGGAGQDVFRFSSAISASNVDRITDFSVIDDILQLENSIFTALTATGALSAQNFRANTTGSASDSNDHVLYSTSTGQLFYDADGSGAGIKVLIATLAGTPALTAADIFVT